MPSSHDDTPESFDHEPPPALPPSSFELGGDVIPPTMGAGAASEEPTAAAAFPPTVASGPPATLAAPEAAPPASDDDDGGGRGREGRIVWWDRLVLTGVVGVFLLGAMAMAYEMRSDIAAKRDALADVGAEPVRVQHMVVRQRLIPTRVHAQGMTEPLETRTLAFETGGKLAYTVAEGATVEPGADVARLVLEKFKNASVQAQAGLDAAEAQDEQAEREIARMERLFEGGSVREEQRDGARTAAKLATANLAGAQASLDEARRLERAATLKSPFGAVAIVVVTLLARAGEVVAPGQPVAVVEVQNPLKLVVEVTEDDYYTLLRARNPGVQPTSGGTGRWLPLSCTADFGDAAVALDPLYRALPVRLARIARQVDPLSLHFPLTLEADNTHGRLVAGLFVDVWIDVPPGRPEIRIPRSVTRKEHGDVFVMLVERTAMTNVPPAAVSDETLAAEEAPTPAGYSRAIVRRRRIEVLSIAGDPTHYQVTAGLSAGDLIATSPLEALQDTTPVLVVVE